MTRDEKLLKTIHDYVAGPMRQEVAAMQRKLATREKAHKKSLAAMESLKNNWRETALRREAEIKELKEKIKWLQQQGR